MTTSREREAQDVTTAYQLALAQLGVETVAEAIELWQHVPATMRAEQAARWLNQAVATVISRRIESVALARAYYRLVRALITGKTVADPYTPEPEFVTLSTLRSQFTQLAAPYAPEAAQPADAGTESQAANTPADGAAGQGENDPAADDEDQILVEELKHLREQEEADAAAAEEEIRTVLQALGPDNLQSKVDQLDTEAPAHEVDAARQRAHDEAGARQAAAAARVAMNGARSTTWAHQENDKRAIGYVRYSKTGTPCGWCAMLISRGVVYKSKRSAERTYEEGDLYHDNCHCAALPVFSTEQYANDPRFGLNREYAQLWPTVTEGLGGKSAVSAWRRFIRTQQAAAKRKAA